MVVASKMLKNNSYSSGEAEWLFLFAFYLSQIYDRYDIIFFGKNQEKNGRFLWF